MVKKRAYARWEEIKLTSSTSLAPYQSWKEDGWRNGAENQFCGWLLCCLQSHTHNFSGSKPQRVKNLETSSEAIFSLEPCCWPRMMNFMTPTHHLSLTPLFFQWLDTLCGRTRWFLWLFWGWWSCGFCGETFLRFSYFIIAFFTTASVWHHKVPLKLSREWKSGSGNSIWFLLEFTIDMKSKSRLLRDDTAKIVSFSTRLTIV